MPYKCKGCNRTFKTLEGVISHGFAKNHPVSHEPVFSTNSVVASVHTRSFKCVQCNGKAFGSQRALDDHIRDAPAHKQLVQSGLSRNKFCHICDKSFGSPMALQQHNSSPVHRRRSIPCFVCPSKFKTPSGLAHHVEGNCDRLRITRHQVTTAVQALKIKPAISLRSPIENPAAAPSPRPLITYHTTELATWFNGKGYQCHLCNRTFRALPSLEAHLNSPAHDDDEFKCPKCKRHFTLVSGLIQHLESASCGLSGIEDVGKRFTKMTAKFSRSLSL